MNFVPLSFPSLKEFLTYPRKTWSKL